MNAIPVEVVAVVEAAQAEVASFERAAAEFGAPAFRADPQKAVPSGPHSRALFAAVRALPDSWRDGAVPDTGQPTADEIQGRFREARKAADAAGRRDLAPLLRDLAWYWRYQDGVGTREIWAALAAASSPSGDTRDRRQIAAEANQSVSLDDLTDTYEPVTEPATARSHFRHVVREHDGWGDHMYVPVRLGWLRALGSPSGDTGEPSRLCPICEGFASESDLAPQHVAAHRAHGVYRSPLPSGDTAPAPQETLSNVELDEAEETR